MFRTLATAVQLWPAVRYIDYVIGAWRELLPWLPPRRWRHLIPVQTKGTITMAGYLNRVIHLGFPELAGVDQYVYDDAVRRGLSPEDARNAAALCWIKIKNPKLQSGDELFSASDGEKVVLGPDGEPAGEVRSRAVYETFARLVIAGNVWDASDYSDDPPLIAMPPGPDDMGRMPVEVLNSIGKEMSKLNPK